MPRPATECADTHARAVGKIGNRLRRQAKQDEADRQLDPEQGGQDAVRRVRAATSSTSGRQPPPAGNERSAEMP
eukprot:7177049-Alexandrium_andersonii.AAC.1